MVLASHLQLRELEVGQSELAMNEILPIDIIDSFLEEAAAVDMIVADPAILLIAPLIFIMLGFTFKLAILNQLLDDTCYDGGL